MLAPSLALLVGGLFAAPATPGPRVAVIVTAPGANDAAELERAVSSRLSSDPGVRLLSVDEVAESLAVDEPIPAAVDPITRAGAVALWESAHNAYVEANYKDALTALDELSPIVERLSAAERVRAHELGASVHLKLEDAPAARREAVLSLVAAGDLPADLDNYPPSVRRVFEEAFISLKKGTLTLKRLTANADVTVDDRPVAGGNVVLPFGVHRIRVRAKGFRGIERDFELSGDDTMTLALAPALDARTVRLVGEVLIPDSKISDDQRRSLDRLAVHLDVDALVLADRQAAEKRAAIWWAAPRDEFHHLGSFAPGEAGDGALAERVAGILDEAARPAASSGAGTAPPAKVSRPIDRRVTAGLIFSSLHRTVTGSAGNGFSLNFTGVGPKARIRSEKWGVTGTLEASLQTLGLEKDVIDSPTGGTVTVHANSEITARGSLGYSFRGDAVAGQEWYITPGVEGMVDVYQGSDPTDASGNPLGLNPSQTVIAPSLRLEVYVPVTAKLALSASGNLYPVASMGFDNGTTESPSGTSGTLGGNTTNDGLSGERLSLAANWEVRDRLRIGLDLGYERRQTQFLGQASAPFTPPLTNAVEVWTFETMFVSACYHF